MSDALQRAIDALTIEDVSIRWAHAQLADEYNPKFDTVVDPQVEIKHEVLAFEIIKIGGNAETSRRHLRVFIDLGVRWLHSGDASSAAESGDSEVDSLPEEFALIEAEMVAEYSMVADPGEEALEQFARQNASFHVWPYWREYVANQCHRMNLPRYVLPIRQFVQSDYSTE